MEGLPKRLPIGQVTLKSYLPDLKIYLSRTTGRDFCRARQFRGECVKLTPGQYANSHSYKLCSSGIRCHLSTEPSIALKPQLMPTLTVFSPIFRATGKSVFQTGKAAHLKILFPP